MGAVEMCNNNGHCRKFDAGAMCPSYRATRDEQHLVRGRANTIAARPHRPARSGRAGLERRRGGAETLRFLQGMPARMSDRRRHGEDEDRGDCGARRLARVACANGSLPNCRATRRLPQPSWRRQLRDKLRAAPVLTDNWVLPNSAICRAGARFFPRRRGLALRQVGEQRWRNVCSSPTRSTGFRDR